MFKKLLFLLLLLLPALPQSLLADLDPVDTVWTIHSTEGFESFTVSPDGRYVAALTNDANNGHYFQPAIYDAESGTFIRELDGWNSMSYFGASFSPDSRYLAVSGYSMGVVVWDADSNTIVRELVFDSSATSTLYPSFSPTGDTVVCYSNRYLALLDFNTGAVINQLKLPEMPDKIVYSPRGDKILVLPPHSDKYYLIDIDSMNWYKTIKFVETGVYDEIYGVGFSPDGSKIISNHAGGLVRIINTDDTSLVKKINFSIYLKVCENVIFSNQGNYLISCVMDNDTANILIYDFIDLTVLKTYNLYAEDIKLSDDDLYLYISSLGELNKIRLDWTQSIFYNGNSGNEQTVKPNPISNKGILSLTALSSEPCEIDIYEPGGRHIRKLFSGTPDSNSMELEFDASGMTKGVYFCSIKSKSSKRTVKFIVE